MDQIDLTLLRALVADGRAHFAHLAQLVGLSAPSTAERVRRLEQQGIVTGYHAVVDPASVGLDLTAFVSVTLDTPAARGAFLDALAAIPQVVECHHVAGDDDYLLKVRCAGTRGLESLVSDQLKGIAGVSRTRTSVVLSSPVERPLSPPEAP